MSRSLRVIMAMDSYPPDSFGGAERVVHAWSRELAARGHAVVVLAGQEAAAPRPDEEAAGYRVRWWACRRRTFADLYRSAIRACAEGVRRLAAEFGPDLIHGHQGLSAYAALRARCGAPAIYTFHGPWGLEFGVEAQAREAALPPALRWPYRWAARAKALRVGRMERRVLSACRGTTVMSEFSRDLLASVHGPLPGGVRLLRPGVDLEGFAPAAGAERAALRARLGFDGPTLLSVRRLVRRMGLDLLIRAMARVRERVPGARLVLVGKGPERAALERLAGELGLAEAVRFAGFVPEEVLPDYYRAADLFVLPTRSLEGFGMSTLEALAVGTPAVGTPAGATPELLRPIEPGLVAREVTPEGIAEAVLRWLERPESLAALRLRCREHVERRYRWADSARALEAFYLGCLGAGKG